MILKDNRKLLYQGHYHIPSEEMDDFISMLTEFRQKYGKIEMNGSLYNDKIYIYALMSQGE